MRKCVKCEKQATVVFFKQPGDMAFYYCGECTPGHKPEPHMERERRGDGPNLGVIIKRKLINKQITRGQESYMLDKTISPEDGKTIISRRTGRPVHWQG